MASFQDLKRSSASNFESLTKELSKLNTLKDNDRDEYWQPTIDKAGNGFAVIRFLQASKDEEIPFVRIWEHGFKGPTGQWYIEKSLTTLGKPDPVSEYNMELWNSTTDDNSPARKQARDQKRKLIYVSNIYVISDPSNKDNEGKVFKFKYGKKIFDKLNDLMNPQFEDEKPVNPFDFWQGANFKLKVRKVEGYRNYDKSEFESVSPLFEDDSKIEEVWNKQYPLQPLTDPSSFKSYEELKKRFDMVLGKTPSPARREAPKQEVREEEKLPQQAPPWENQPSKSPKDEDSEDDDLEFFKKLAGKDD